MLRSVMEEELYHAELADASRDSNLLNTLAASTIIIAIIFLFLGITFGEAIKSQYAPEEEDYGVRVPVWERGYLDYITNESNGYVLEKGSFEIFETEVKLTFLAGTRFLAISSNIADDSGLILNKLIISSYGFNSGLGI